MSGARFQIDQYKKSAVTSASPLQLVVMLYDGALKNLASAQKAMSEKDTYAQNQHLQKAQKIIAELISCLDMNKGGEIAQHLLALYSFCYNKLVECNLNDDPEGIDQVTVVLSNLRSSWEELEKMVRQPKGTQNEAA
ncbi:MAG: flagellar export chaperone FliS [Armatimonadetes bacterium]|nr:flagellar export chaperone FliS [Armatimonadota bacterium]